MGGNWRQLLYFTTPNYQLVLGKVRHTFVAMYILTGTHFFFLKRKPGYGEYSCLIKSLCQPVFAPPTFEKLPFNFRCFLLILCKEQ
jgi:hypothetical protein